MNKSLRNLLQSEYHNSLVGELQCACENYLEPPIVLCKRGHGSCQRCRRRFQRCSTCKEPFTETRSVALEKLAEKMQFPCPNAGCVTKASLQQMETHQSVCPFRDTACLMNKVYGGCDWRGKVSDWLDHCAAEHSERITDLPFAKFSDPWLPKTRNPIMRYHLLRCFDRVFNVYQIYDRKSGKMMWTVIATGEAQDTKRFFFDLEMINPDDPMRRILIRQPCKTENDADILEASQNVLISVEQIMYMLDEEKHVNFALNVQEYRDEKEDNE